MSADVEDPRRRFERVREVFLRVAELDDEGRKSVLAHEAPDVAAEVLALCRADERLQPDSSETPPARLNAPPPRVGKYSVGTLLGSGADSDVFMGVDDDPHAPAVALKILRPATTAEQRRRFVHESQALSRLDHPGIAHIYAVDTLADGRPYLVLQLIPDALPLVAHCDRRRLNVGQRVALLVEVCRAVEHAHQRGVIHRDLKPSNILCVDAGTENRAYVIDFGIAKVLDDSVGTDLTRTGVWRGTPGYMSPEQLDRSHPTIDVRSDVFALGAVLCELLAGDLPGKASDPRPSALLAPTTRSNERLIDVAFRRSTTPAELRRTLRGSLDWVAERALQHDRDKRYADVSSLREDLERFLQGLPVVGVATNLGYRARLFARRHRTRLSVMAGALVAIAFTTTMVVQRRADWDREITALIDSARQQTALATELRRENPDVPPSALFVLREAARALARAPWRARRRSPATHWLRTARSRSPRWQASRCKPAQNSKCRPLPASCGLTRRPSRW